MVCAHRAIYSVLTSPSSAPIVFILTNPRMPNVDGNSHDSHCQNSGIALCGQDTPEMNSNGTDVNTTTSMMFSRWRIVHDTIIEKNMHDSTYGSMNQNVSPGLSSDVKLNMRGTTSAT